MRIAKGLQNQTAGVGENHDGLQVVDFAGKRIDDRLGQRLQAAVAGEPLGQFAGVQAREVIRGGVEAIALAAAPGVAQQRTRFDLWRQGKRISWHGTPRGFICVAIL